MYAHAKTVHQFIFCRFAGTNVSIILSFKRFLPSDFSSISSCGLPNDKLLLTPSFTLCFIRTASAFFGVVWNTIVVMSWFFFDLNFDSLIWKSNKLELITEIKFSHRHVFDLICLWFKMTFGRYVNLLHTASSELRLSKRLNVSIKWAWKTENCFVCKLE